MVLFLVVGSLTGSGSVAASWEAPFSRLERSVLVAYMLAFRAFIKPPTLPTGATGVGMTGSAPTSLASILSGIKFAGKLFRIEDAVVPSAPLRPTV